MRTQKEAEKARDALSALLNATPELRAEVPEIFALNPHDRVSMTAALEVIDWILENADGKTFETVLGHIDEAFEEFSQIKWVKGN